MIEKLSDFPSNVAAFECSGRVTRGDYDAVLVPAVEAALKAHDKLRLFYKVSAGFTGIEPGAAWEDFRVGVSHWRHWERIAVVTDVEWIAHAIQAFGFLMPAAVKVFSLPEENQARAWIKA